MKQKNSLYLKVAVTVGAAALVGIFVQNQLLFRKLKDQKKRKYFREKYFDTAK